MSETWLCGIDAETIKAGDRLTLDGDPKRTIVVESVKRNADGTYVIVGAALAPITEPAP